MVRVFLLSLALLVCAGAVSGNESQATLVADPCQAHTCPEGKVCKKVTSEKLLLFPVATCVKDETSTEGPCTKFAVASNVLNCKTKEAWERAASIQCSAREGGMVLHEAEVQHVCYSSTGSTTYLRVEVVCCPVVMPTSPSDTPQQVTENGFPEDAYPQDKPNSNDPSSSEPPTDQQPVAGDSMLDKPADPESSPAPELYTGAFTFYLLPLVLGAIVLLLVMLLACIMGCRRCALERRLRKKVQTPRTVYINPDFKDYQVMSFSGTANKRKP